MTFEAHLVAILERDPARLNALAIVRTLGLADGWIGAGFVRDAVWDSLHDGISRLPTGDVDVIWFDPTRLDPRHDLDYETWLKRRCPDFVWSVKNQARMHDKNGDAPYGSVAEAMEHWPETATAVAVRLSLNGKIEINAPFGLNDLFALRLVPTQRFVAEKLWIFNQRIREKRWLERYPRLVMA